MDKIKADIRFVKKQLPEHYTVQESNTKGSIHCVSKIGIRKPPYLNESTGRMVDDAEDEIRWESIFQLVKFHFGKRFQEVDHNVCFCHTDFTIYLKYIDENKV